jgi:hypothetical protein
MIPNDGDIVRGLGFVTLYAAYLQEQIDKLLIDLDLVEKYDAKKQKLPISGKINHARKIVEKLDKQKFGDLAQDLCTCKDLFEARNELVHGRIYANYGRPDTLKSGRPNIPEREVLPEELYELANAFAKFISAIYRPMISELPRAINAYLKK